MVIDGELAMRELGRKLGSALSGGEVFELVGDVGAGKTTFTKGLAEGMAIEEPVQSPTFTISRVYSGRDNLELRHYDFYRLGDAGIMADELHEAVGVQNSVTVVEWAEAVSAVLPDDRLRVVFEVVSEHTREVQVAALGPASRGLIGGLR